MEGYSENILSIEEFGKHLERIDRKTAGRLHRMNIRLQGVRNMITCINEQYELQKRGDAIFIQATSSLCDLHSRFDR
jgi:hypothetical protein